MAAVMPDVAPEVNAIRKLVSVVPFLFNRYVLITSYMLQYMPEIQKIVTIFSGFKIFGINKATF